MTLHSRYGGVVVSERLETRLRGSVARWQRSRAYLQPRCRPSDDRCNYTRTCPNPDATCLEGGCDICDVCTMKAGHLSDHKFPPLS